MTVQTEHSRDMAFISQARFRALMNAFARPGTIVTVTCPNAPRPLAEATAGVLECLCDFETPVWLAPSLETSSAVVEWVRFRTGSPVGPAAEASFAVVSDKDHFPDLDIFTSGSADYPDRSTTVLIQIEDFDGKPYAISGPGIQQNRSFSAASLPPDFIARMTRNRWLYPRGVDVLLVSGDRLLALPRSVHIQEA
ncbi:MAG TPA: phosphonate C-P lyase system protein PhnH [Xanthobacteraceae bacterium]|nr:phosphonate C-P lyase system protein PhnH [Xanthobacteraceae bacterium]